MAVFVLPNLCSTEVVVAWTDRDKKTRKPLSPCCLYCRCVILKLFRCGAFQDKAKTATALGHLCRSSTADLNMRNEFLLARETYMEKKIPGTSKSRIPLTSLAPRQACQIQQSANLAIRGPEFDLVPEDIFLKHSHGKTFKECGLTEITMDRPVGGSLTGVLLYADNWNTPLGCWRLSYFEAMNAIKKRMSQTLKMPSCPRKCSTVLRRLRQV